MSVVAVKKLSVALDAEVATAAATEAAREGISLSAWLTRAAREALAVEEGLAGVRAYEAEFGPIGDDARAWAQAVIDEHLGPAPQPRNR